jgi:1-acyl-sn-glycerol-3-phosphate acyltransferase
MREWLGSLVFTAYLFVSVAVYGIVVLAARAFGYRAAYRGVLLWVDCTLWLLRVLCGLGHRVRGRHNLPVGNCIVFMKHSSAWETIAQLRLFPQQTWVMKRELLWAPVLGWVLWGLKPIAINRAGGRKAVEQVIKRGRARLREGFWVVIFPEGTRVAAGTTRRYGVSGTLLAEAAGAPIVPVAHNAGAFWPRRGMRKRAGTIDVVIGEPVVTAGREPREINLQIQTWIEAEIARMES